MVDTEREAETPPSGFVSVHNTEMYEEIMNEVKKQRIATLFAESLVGMPHVLLLDTASHGLSGYAALGLAARCFAEEIGRVCYDPNGRPQPAAPQTHIDDLSHESFLVGARVRQAVDAGMWFIVCYKAADEPEWRAAWSPDQTPRQAALMMLAHVTRSIPQDG